MADAPKWDETDEISEAPKFDDTEPVAFDGTTELPPGAEPTKDENAGYDKYPRMDTSKSWTGLEGIGQRTDDALANVRHGTPLSGFAENAGAALAATGDDSDEPFIRRYQKQMDRLEMERDARFKRNPDASKNAENLGAALAPNIGASGTGVKNALSRIAGNGGLAAADKAGHGGSLDEVKKEGMVAGGLQAFMESLGGIGRFAKGASESRALKSLEPTLSQQKVLQDKGKAQELGREMLDEGVVKFGSSVDDMAPRVDNLLSEKGQRIGAIRDLADKRGAQVEFDRLAKKGTAKEAFSDATNETSQSAARAYSRNADNFAKVPQRSISEAQQEVRALDSQIPFEKDMAKLTPEQQAYRELRGDIVNQSDDQIRQRVPESIDEYLKTKEQFGLYKDADKVLDTATARGSKNATFPMSSLLAANAAAKSGDALGVGKAGLAAVATKLAKERGNSAIAVTADRMSQLLGQNPSRLGKFMQPLVDAAKRGNQSLMATHMLLMKEPEYAQLVGEGEQP